MMFDRLLDATVALSFGRPGYHRRRAQWRDPELRDHVVAGRRVVVTGASSGLGEALALGLARRGARVVMVGRSAERTEAARERVAAATGPEACLETLLCDVGELDQIDALADALVASGPVDGLVHNAGALLHEITRTAAGHEVTLAVHVLGPLRLTARLQDALAASEDGRVIWVTSGGMYLQPLERAVLLDPDSPGAPAYDGVKAYARAKRAQVVCNRLLARRLGQQGVFVAAMHPGWADTPGVQRALPGFRRLTKAILRDAAEGADTALWLAAAPRDELEAGRLYLDRIVREDAIFPGTATSNAEAAALWRDLCRIAEVDGPFAEVPA